MRHRAGFGLAKAPGPAIVNPMARTLFNQARLAHTITVARSFAEAESQDRRECWRMTPIKRLETIELLRQMNHPYDPDTARLPRVFESVK
jgi:hypothetical protein